MSRFLTRDQILTNDDRTPTFTPVEVPEWGGSVMVRVMSGRERERFEAALEKGDTGNIRARLAAICTCDESGKSLFSEADVQALGEKSVTALHRVHEAAKRLNKLEVSDVDGLEKNSGAAS